MQALTLEIVRSLASTHEAPCLSVYSPFYGGRRPDDAQQRERLLRRAREALGDRCPPKQRDELLAALASLSASAAQPEGARATATFVAPDFQVGYALPVEVPELVVAADSFHIRPLLGHVQANRHYFVLLLAQGHVGFFKGSAEGLIPVASGAVPRSLEDALGSEDRERSVTYHSGARAGDSAIYGGEGKADTSRDEDLLRFCRAIDAVLWSVLREENAPLLLAASERLAAIYRSISRYAHSVRELLPADLGRATIAEIHARIAPRVEKLMGEREGVVLERYDRSLSGARALDDVRAIGRFAIGGRVRDLLLDRNTNLWGRLNRETGEVALFGQRPDDSAEDVLDDLAEAVMLRGGEVWSLDTARMPTKSSVAATLRW
jgi:hypothetical protein